MIRQTFWQLITTDPDVAAVIPPERWFARGSVVDTPTTPYGVLADLGTDTGATRQFGVYVHDEPGSYVAIDDVLKLVRRRVESVAQYLGPDGRLVGATHLTTSEDGTDQSNGTGVKNSIYRYLGVENG